MGTNNSHLQQAPQAKTMEPVPAQSLADALFTGTQQRLLGLFFGQTGRSFFVTELIELAGVGRGSVQRELARLDRSGLVLTDRHGNQKHYRANPDAPIHEELCSIVRKTIGVQHQVRAALAPIDPKISLALIYGSVAKRLDTAMSDIDLLVVSNDLTLEDIYSRLSAVEKQLGRPINPTLYTERAFEERRSTGNEFLKRILDAPALLLKGSIGAE